MMKKYIGKITNILRLSDEIYQYQVELDEPITWSTGANMHIGLPGFDAGEEPNKSLVHHMSICSSCSESCVRFVTRIPDENPSIFKNALKQLTVGDSLTVFKIDERLKIEKEKATVYVSQGVGLASLYPLIKAHHTEKDMNSLLSIHISKENDHIFHDEFKTYQSQLERYESPSKRADFYQCLENNYQSDAVYYIVGNDTFLVDVLRFLKQHQHPKTQIQLDKKAEKMETLFAEAGYEA